MENKSLSDFCVRLAGVSQLSSLQRALAILYWLEINTDKTNYTPGELSRIMSKNALSVPNSTQLKKSIIKSRLAIKMGSSFKLKTESKTIVHSWVKDILGNVPPNLDHTDGFLSDEIWRGTKVYLEKVCEQLNGCVIYGFYDAAAVLIRRIIETLLIESFIYLKIEIKIKDNQGNFLMMGALIEKSLGDNGLPLGRDSKKYLKDLKDLGDRSAHKRNYNAVRSDLTKIKTGLRVVVDELIQMSNMKQK